MTDRAHSALKATGMDETPIASLEKDDALFALTAQTLLFQDGGGTRRVTLRDLTRIHSDQEGTLRVETPAGTALTASLLGFDAARVQAFFAQVRDTTARAKQQAAASQPSASQPSASQPSASQPSVAQPSASQPSVAQPTAPQASPALPSVVSAPVPVGPPPAAPVAPTPVTPEPPQPEPRTAPPTIVIGGSDSDGGDEAAEAPAVAPVTRTVIIPAPSLAKPVAAPAPSTPPTPQPVVISSSGFSPSSARPTVPYGSGTASPGGTSAAFAPVAQPAATPTPAISTPKVTAPKAAAPIPPVAAAPAPSASTIQPTAIKTLPTRSASVSGLYAQADTVEALVSRLRILGVVLGVSAIALAFFLFTAGQGLSGIWTLIAGGVGGISLLAVAELARLLVAIARATGGGSSPDNS